MAPQKLQTVGVTGQYKATFKSSVLDSLDDARFKR
jgi:hypothetical protein